MTYIMYNYYGLCNYNLCEPVKNDHDQMYHHVLR